MAKYRLLYASYLEKYKDVIEFTRNQLIETSRFQQRDIHPWSLPEHRLNHTHLVLRNSLVLAKNRKVDMDVVALAAILHDVAFYSPERMRTRMHSMQYYEDTVSEEVLSKRARNLYREHTRYS
jgi:HD superfamily phosphodiesterase